MSVEPTTKAKFGQFYTKNYEYILQGFKIPKKSKSCKIIEPFCGAGDLVKYIKSELGNVSVECYDIDSEVGISRDTLMDPPNYIGKFIVTNPPYLAKNKAKDKTIFNKYGVDDLYKAFLKTIILDVTEGGIIIIPLNFWCSIRKADIALRREFLRKYIVQRINIFYEQVFEDTTYTVCSLQFKKINIPLVEARKLEVEIIIFPNKEIIKTIFNSKNNYMIGGHIYKLSFIYEGSETRGRSIFVNRLTSKTQNDDGITSILAKCIDDADDSKIGLSLQTGNKYCDNTPNLSARTYCTLIINPPISDESQKILVKKFNKYLNSERMQYHSLFLTNYREGDRKRISFDLVYSIIKYIIYVENLYS